MIITLKRPGTCSVCGKALQVGDRARWFKSAREIRCPDHPDERPYAEQIEAKKERAECRQERLEARAERLQGESERRFGTVNGILEHIPMGQPILVGHHSERHARADAARIDTNMRKGIEAQKEAKDAAYRAEASARNIERMERPDVTKRRIDKLEADKRKVERRIAEESAALEKGIAYDWRTDAYVEMNGPARANFANSIEHDKSEVAKYQGQIDYWRAHLESIGAKFFQPSDFQKGDIIESRQGRAQIVRVNPKTLSVVFLHPAIKGWPGKLGYEEVKGFTANATAN